MDYVDMFHPSQENLLDKDMLENHIDSIKKRDKGYSKIVRTVVRSDGQTRRKNVDIYASGHVGSRIRDAETGQSYSHDVGSSDEDLYFKITFATGECKNMYNSNTLFYLSPQQCIDHLNIDIDQETIGAWQEKRNNRVKNIEKNTSSKRQ
jgi:hypothetical protein